MNSRASSLSLSLLLATGTLFACGSTASPLSTSDEDLIAVRACDGKQCGASCRLCDGSDPNCVETAVMKACDGAGRCSAGTPACAAPYEPCGGKQCGDGCTVCDPADRNCFETAVMKSCDAQGKCVPEIVECSAIDAGPAPYDPCGGKKCGDGCTACDPADTDCIETDVIKACTADGQCVGGSPVCAAKDGGAAYDPCGGKQCGDGCRVCPPGDPSCVETAVLKECSASGRCVPGVALCGAKDGGAAP